MTEDVQGRPVARARHGRAARARARVGGRRSRRHQCSEAGAGRSGGRTPGVGAPTGYVSSTLAPPPPPPARRPGTTAPHLLGRPGARPLPRARAPCRRAPMATPPPAAAGASRANDAPGADGEKYGEMKEAAGSERQWSASPRACPTPTFFPRPRRLARHPRRLDRGRDRARRRRRAPAALPPAHRGRRGLRGRPRDEHPVPRPHSARGDDRLPGRHLDRGRTLLTRRGRVEGGGQHLQTGLGREARCGLPLSLSLSRSPSFPSALC